MDLHQQCALFLVAQYIWQGLDIQHPTKQLQKHLVGELLIETPLCPRLWQEVLGSQFWKDPKGQMAVALQT